MAIDKKHYTGGNTEGGITSSYATDDGATKFSLLIQY